MKYKQLAELYDSLESTTKRLKKTEILSEFLKKIPEEDKDVLYLLLGRVFPEYDKREIGISNQLTIKAIAKATGESSDEVVKKWKSVGDLGKVAGELAKHKKQATLHHHELDTKKVLDNLRKLPELEGKGTIDKKISLITELLVSATPLEALYIARTLIGDLRIGIKESTIRYAMADAFFHEDKKEAVAKIASALETTNDIGEVFESAKKGLKNLEESKISVGKPLKVMLAQKAKTIEDGFKMVGKPAAIEYKYDGFRMLINKDEKGKISIFTRRLENVTKQFPEVEKYVERNINAKTFIIDAEAVGYDGKTKIYQPFQSISQRIKRKYDIEKMQKDYPVELNVFDILYHNGKSLLKEPFKDRSKLIRKILKNEKWKIVAAKQIVTGDEKKTEEFYKSALKENQEGVMMKNLEAEYKPGSRVGYMIKIKPEERDYDLVIIGAEYGTGKRAGWLSSFSLGCRHGKEFLEIGKVGTGIKEKSDGGVSFSELTKKLKPLVTEEKGREVKIKPKVVVSVTYQEIQKSPTYSSGFALRFPRVTALRPDRSPGDIENLEQIKNDYKKQGR